MRRTKQHFILLSIWIPLSVLPIPSCRSQLAPGVISHQPKECISTFFLVWFSWQKHSLKLPILWNVFLLLLFFRAVLLVIGFWMNKFCFCFQQFKAVIPPSSGCHSSINPDEKLHTIYISVPLCVVCLFVSTCSQDFSFILGKEHSLILISLIIICNLTIICIHGFHLYFFCFEFTMIHGSICKNLVGGLPGIAFSNIFYALIPLSFCWGSITFPIDSLYCLRGSEILVRF